MSESKQDIGSALAAVMLPHMAQELAALRQEMQTAIERAASTNAPRDIVVCY